MKINSIYIFLLLVIAGLVIKLFFFGDTESSKLLKEQIKIYQKENDSLLNNEINYKKQFDLLQDKIILSEEKNRKLTNSFYILNRNINNKIIQDEQNLNSINGINNTDANAYLASYKFRPFTKD